MGTKIALLDECTINKIAAGEVIENPASVVKELVDNSIDAGATEITVEIAAGGRQLIRVSDNGGGMSPDDALLSLERHATSKIRSVEEILSITSMGFRGEAIPSIASISKFALLTATKESEERGTMVIVEGGRILRVCDAVRSPGTTIEVKSLFFNVPVRKKFQRSPTYDANEIQKILCKLALAHPRIAFELISSGKSLLKASRGDESSLSEQLLRRISDLLGTSFVDRCCALHHASCGFEVAGFIGLPSNTRPNRTGQYTFINERPVFSPLIHSAVREGYSTTLPTNRHPIFVIHVKMPGELVDVNVHPQKKEVRVRQEGMLKRAVAQAVDKALHGSGLSFAPADFIESSPFLPPYRDEGVEEPFPFFAPPLPGSGFFEEGRPSPREERSFTAEELPLEGGVEASPPPPFSPSPIELRQRVEEKSPSLFSSMEESGVKPVIIGTIPGYFIVDGATLPNGQAGGFCVIDQKGAHARIIFEGLIEGQKGARVDMQQLLVPLALELTAGESELLRQHLDLLAERGVLIREFGLNSFVLDSIPSAFGDIDLQAFAEELISCLGSDAPFSLQSAFEKRLQQLASRLAISRRVKITPEEALSLTLRLFACKKPYHSPTGSPTLLSFDEAELSKKFR